MASSTDPKQKSKKNNNEGVIRPSIAIRMIRHAESKNNEVYRTARHLFKGGTPEFDVDGWNNYVENNRSADPDISSTGIQQAEMLKKYLVAHLDNQSSHPIRIITSPMRRTMKTILPTLENLKGDAEIIVNGLYFESEGCHIKDQPLPGMNQHAIKDFLSTATASKPPSFVGFDEDPSVGWYNHGTGPETRAQSEIRAAAFYMWLCDYLDLQLQSHNDEDDVFDAGVALDEEKNEHWSDKLSPRLRRRRTAVLVGHGDFMSLVLKRIVAGFGHHVENDGIPHRSAFTHVNTGITELEYFGNGRFLMMHTNSTPHLQNNLSLLTGGGLKDGWSYLMPRDDTMLYEEVTSAFADEHEKHVMEQVGALKNLYVSDKKKGSLLERKNSIVDEKDNKIIADTSISDKTEMIFVVKRGLQVAGSVSLRNGELSHMAVRPSAKDDNVENNLIQAVRNHAAKIGMKEISAVVNVENRHFFEAQNFEPSSDADNLYKLLIVEDSATALSSML
jgi:broad specificity phosphatase PhoE/N-acetylglutamate synthase-like GNAT family acetyltransferase